jgi:hypothetical protein
MTPSPEPRVRADGGRQGRADFSGHGTIRPAGPSGMTTRPGRDQLDFGVKFHKYGYALPTCVCTLVFASVA